MAGAPAARTIESMVNGAGQSTFHRLRILHLSDLHLRGPREPDRARRARVLGDAWLENLAELRRDGPFDLVVFTGDVAFSGAADEYLELMQHTRRDRRVVRWLDETLTAAGCGRAGFFVVPGNHDVDRRVHPDVWRKVRDAWASADRGDDGAFARWLVRGGAAPRGIEPAWRELLFDRQAAYRAWGADQLGRPDLLGDPSRSLVGYRATPTLDRLPFPVYIIGLDSAWLAGGNDDARKLRVTDDQIHGLCSDEDGDPLEGLRIALIHHPLAELADGERARRLLREYGVDLLLSGHLHEPEARAIVLPDGCLRDFATGCLYEHDRYPNATTALTLDVDGQGRVHQIEFRFRSWSDRAGAWHDDNSLYRGTRDGRLLWPTSPPRIAATCSEAAPPSLPPPEPRAHVVVDERTLAELTSHLLAGRWIGIFGLSGSGKSTLAACAAWRCVSEIATVWLSAGDQDVGFLLETLARAVGVSLAGIAGLENQANCVRAATAAGGRLFVFDDVSRESIAAVLLQSVAACNAVIVTGLDAGLLAVTRYRLVKIATQPLSPEQSREIAMRLIRNEWATEHPPELEAAAADAVVRLAGGQPAVIEALVGELNAIGLDAAPDLEATIGGIASRSECENLRILGARTLGAIGDGSSRIVRALHVFSSNRVAITALATVTGCDVRSGLRGLRRRLIVKRDGDVVTFHDYVRRLSLEICDDVHHAELARAHAAYHIQLAERYGGYESSVRAYPLLVPHESELIPLLLLSIQRWDDRDDETALGDALTLAFRLSWYLHWRGYSETRFRMCDAIIQRSARLRGRGHPVPQHWSNVIGNLHVDQGWVLLAHGEHGQARGLAADARAWIHDDNRMYVDDLDAQAAFLMGDHGHAMRQFSALMEQVPERTRTWHAFAMRLADVQLAAGEGDACDRLLAHLLTTTERPLLVGGEVIEDLRARILMRCAARDFARNDQHLGMSRLLRAVELFEMAGGVIEDRVRAMVELAIRIEAVDRRNALLRDAQRYARTLGGRALISEVEQVISSDRVDMGSSPST